MTGNDDHPIAPAEAHANFLRAVLTLEAAERPGLQPEAANPNDDAANRVPPTAHDHQGAAARRPGRGNAPARRTR